MSEKFNLTQEFQHFRKWRDPVRWDEASRVYFPLFFFIFNVGYWSYYVGYHKFIKPML